MPSKHGFRSRLRGLFSSSDDAPTHEMIKQDDDRGQTGTTASLPNSSDQLPSSSAVPNQSTVATNPTPHTSAPSMPTSLAERLWDQAYDDLKLNHVGLVEAYEKILSRKLGGQGFSSPVTESEKNIIAQDDSHERRNQMRQLIQDGLKKTEKEAKLKETIGTATEFVLSAKELISSAVEAVPQAALAWTGVCVALEMLQNPIAATEANRRGIEYVTKRMDWYWKLSSAVLKDNIHDASIAQVRQELETQVIDLYKALLSYEMKSICSYYRNRGLALLRDIVNLDDWNGDLQTVQNAERVFHDDSSAFTGLQMVSNLEQLVTHAENQSTAQITKEDQQCIKDLRLTDPREDKKRIEQTKGGLLQESYTWILHNPDYQEWLDSDESRLLWVKGDPGKGKTMLLCGIIDELNRQSNTLGRVSYFFFQATDKYINNATAALRGLIFMLINQQPSLTSHLRKKYDQAGGKLFEGSNTWIALSDIFTAILQDPDLKRTCLVVDALDECVSDFEKLLDLIVLATGIECPVKWIVSSRNWPQIEERLQSAEQKVKLSLELNAKSISKSVEIYIEKKVKWLSKLKKYDDTTSSHVKSYLSKNANDTFLWVSLVCQNLEKYSRWKILEKLETFPPGLNPLYERMMAQILSMEDEEDVSHCKEVLAVIMSVYRPITLKELGCLINIRHDLSVDVGYLKEIVVLCGSFLTIRDDTVYFVHQSAKDYLSKNDNVIFPSGRAYVHYNIFSLSLQAMNKSLRKNICALTYLGLLPEDATLMSDTGPLAAVRYSSVYWVDHLREGCASELNDMHRNVLYDDGAVYLFLREHLLHWLEALSLLHHLSVGVISITALEALAAAQSKKGELRSFLRDAHRFVLYNRRAIEVAPLQTYSSALVFAPLQSLVRKAFSQEIPAWFRIRPPIEDKWSPCLQTLEGHTGAVQSVAFLADYQRIASGSSDSTIKIWDIDTGACIQTFNGHTGPVYTVAFLPDSRKIASGSYDKTIKVWDITTAVCDQTLEGHTGAIWSIAVLTKGRLASGSSDKTVKIWDIITGACVLTLKGHTGALLSVAFLSDSQQIISGSEDRTIKIWGITTGMCIQTLERYPRGITAVATSAAGEVVSASRGGYVTIWNIATGTAIRTLLGHTDYVSSVAYLSSQRVISGAADSTIKIWDADTGGNIQTLEGHNGAVNSVVPLARGQVASGSNDGTVKIWDISMDADAQISHTKTGITAIALSLDRRQVASGSDENTIEIWDMDTSVCVQTLEGHTSFVTSIIFLNNGQLASVSFYRTIKIWDLNTGDCIQTLELPDEIEYSGIPLAFSTDGQYLVFPRNHTIEIRDVAAGWKCVRTFKGHAKRILSVAFTADGRYIASGSAEDTVKIWDVAAEACILTLDVGLVRYLSFDPRNNSRLYSDFGTLVLDLNLVQGAVESVSQPPLQRAVICGYGITKDREWITKDGKPLLWLPAEYRPVSLSIAGPEIVIGCASGRVFVVKISDTELDT